MPRKKYNTPHPTHIVKTRLTDKQYAIFTEALSHCKLSQAEFIRQAITGRSIKATIRVSHVDDELLQRVSKLTAEYGKIGSNLNQIAKRLNEFGEPYFGMVQELKAASADLSGLKYETQRKRNPVTLSVTNTKDRPRCALPLNSLWKPAYMSRSIVILLR